MRRREKPTLPPPVVGLALVAAIFLAYARVWHNGFVDFDDGTYLVGNPIVREGWTWEGLRWAFTTTHGSNWHPLTWLSHMLDCELFGLDPAWHHAVNVALHALNALLLFGVLRSMSGDCGSSALVAALFGLHPLRVESVAWISERKDLLAGLFWMLTLAAYARYARRPARGRYLLVVAAMTVGLLAKPMLVTLPFVLLLLDFWPLRRWPERSLRRLLVEKIPLLVLSLASAILTLWAQHRGGSVQPLEVLSPASRIANALVACVAYLWKTLWPARLACFYPHPAAVSPEVREQLFRLAVPAGLALAAGTWAVVRSARRRPYAAVGWFWFLGTLVPVIGLVQVGDQALADRYTYLPLVGIYVLVVWSLADAARLWPGVKVACSIAAPLALAAATVLTWIQVGYWKNDRLLFEHALAVTSHNHVAHNNVGVVLQKQGNSSLAREHYERALAIKPRYFQCLNNLGRLLEEQGAGERAEVYYRRALEINPDYASAHSNLGNLMARRGELARAEEHYERALAGDPTHAPAHSNLGVILAGRGELRAAVAHYREALRNDPAFADAHNNLGAALAASGDLDGAMTHLTRALEIRPAYPEAHTLLADVLARRGSLADAAAHYQRALALQPNKLDALSGLASVHARAGDFAEAVRWQRVVLERVPASAKDEARSRLELYESQAAKGTTRSRPAALAR